jgi:hypothetical protein
MTIQLDQDAIHTKPSTLETIDSLLFTNSELSEANAKLQNLTGTKIIKLFLSISLINVTAGILASLIVGLFLSSLISLNWLCWDFAHHVANNLMMPRIQSEIVNSLHLNHSFDYWQSISTHNTPSLRIGFVITAIVGSISSIRQVLRTKLKDLI